MDMRMIFGPIEPSAQRLIESAQALRQSGVALDTLHVVLAALQDTGGQGSMPILPLEDTMRATCQGAIQVQALLNAETNASADAISTRLRQCSIYWNDEATRRSVRLTDVFVVWAVLAKDPMIQQILHMLRVEVSALQRQLETRFEPMDRVSTAVPVPATLSEHDVSAYQTAAQFLEIVRPSPGLHFKNMHAVLMSNVYNVLGKCTLAEFAVLSGRNGSPLDSVPQVIADQLLSGEEFSETRYRLRQMRGVLLLNLVGVHSLANRGSVLSPHDVLRMTMMRAAEEHAVLILNHIEILKHHSEVEASLLAELANPGNTLVLGLYHMMERGEHGALAALRLPNIQAIQAHEYSKETTKALIQEYYLPIWELRDGYTFTPGAFDFIIDLEPGAWIEQRRKTLPYLAVGLGENTIETARTGASLIKDTTTMALDELRELRNEWATCDERVRRRFEGVLEQAQTEIAQLRDNPLPVRNDKGHLVLTRSHVTAQLICPNDSEFHYPGHAPKDLVGHRRDDLPN